MEQNSLAAFLNGPVKSWETLTSFKTLYQEGAQHKNVDLNGDNIFEATQKVSPDGTYKKEEYDWDSNGATDYTRRYKNDVLIDETYWTNNPDDNSLKEPDEADKEKAYYNFNAIQPELEEATAEIYKNYLTEHIDASREARRLARVDSTSYNDKVEELYKKLEQKEIGNVDPETVSRAIEQSEIEIEEIRIALGNQIEESTPVFE